MVPTASQRIIVCPRRRIISVAPTDDHTHAFRRAPERLWKMREVLQKQNCGGVGVVTPLHRQVGRVVEGLVTHGTAPFVGHGFRRARRGKERQASALAPQGGDVGPVVQVDQLHFHTCLSLTSAVPHRSRAETGQMVGNGEPQKPARTLPKGTPYRGERKGACGTDAATPRGLASTPGRLRAGRPGHGQPRRRASRGRRSRSR